jgi:sialidase-1
MSMPFILQLSLTLLGLLAARAPGQAAEGPLEGSLQPFLGNPRFEQQTLFRDQRFPNVIVALDGTVVAVWGEKGIRARRSEDGGRTWGEEIWIARNGIHGGGALVDERSGDLLVFVEERHPPAPMALYRSRDTGRSWQAEAVEIQPDARGHAPSMHMNESGITLRQGPRAGRLVRASRYYAGTNDRSAWPDHYTNAIYSDDGGRTWQTSAPFPENGTGEAAIAELSDGRLYYNSRVHWEKAERPTRRRSALSLDAGETWREWRLVPVLPDGRQDNAYGCMGGLVRLPVRGRDILIFSNLDTLRSTRERVTVWASFDGGASWPVKRLVDEGPGAYSSLAAGRPGTAGEGWVYLFFEAGSQGGAEMARFNLAWLLAGEATGDGTVPDWAR